MFNSYSGHNLSEVAKILLIINVVVFALTELVLGEEITAQFAVYYPGSNMFQPIQLITYMFMHANGMHLFFNMLGLYFFGPAIEWVWGPKRFLFYYLAAGLGALILDFGVKYYQINFMNQPLEMIDTPMVGASGAIFGLLAAYGFLFPNNVVQLLFPPIPMKAKYFVMIYGAIELYSGVQTLRGVSASNVAHFAHLGGAIFGALLILYWNSGGKIGRT
jgi:membrane associated rhomboid family serine protease